MLFRSFLGNFAYMPEVAARTEAPGVATGMAWTRTGGDLLFIEASKMPGKGKLRLTGQLGDVMKESTHIALSLVEANAERLGIERKCFEDFDIHVHVPAGAVPKDGPSAGVTMYTALVSLLTGVRVRGDVSMTGEATLRGLVLPVGGIKDKVLAAMRGGIKKIIFVGNKSYIDQRLKDEIKTSETMPLFSFLQSMDIYDQDRLEADRDLIRRFYVKHGYADVRVVSATGVYDPAQKGFIVTFTIEEGARYKFGKVEIISNVPQVEAAALYGRLKAVSGDRKSTRLNSSH